MKQLSSWLEKWTDWKMDIVNRNWLREKMWYSKAPEYKNDETKNTFKQKVQYLKWLKRKYCDCLDVGMEWIKIDGRRKYGNRSLLQKIQGI